MMRTRDGKATTYPMLRLRVLAVAVLAVSACSGLTDTVVVVRNVGSQRIDAVQIDAGGRVTELGAIDANAQVSMTPAVQQDSSVSVRYREAGLDVACLGDVYLTQNLRARIEVQVGNGTCKVVDATR
ncbi:hypothetical protein RS982_09755 [Stenotrophomonas indicatrix]|uniref:hypothetical protein n=1 Tax=Stenotrophomonas indicatrix TaxID=2045451 RepID=UPI0028EF5582|nr:hypothetical protein [Stenotrophomonas indicatrix]MDT9581590.1 hypothetical protein [Stenotrophomonas indicatrix]